MSNEEKNAIEALKDDIKNADLYDLYSKNETICFIDDVATVLNLIKKQETKINNIYNTFYELAKRCPGNGMKVLSENGFDIKKCDNCDYEAANCKDCIKQYFENKVNSSEQK
jgi:hypothetical protein